MAAADDLYGYYLYQGDKEGINRWEEWLAQRNDSEAIQAHYEKRFLEALDLPDSDVRKLAKLKEAEALMKKWFVLNGRRDRDEIAFHQRIVAEIKRLNAERLREISIGSDRDP